MNTDKPRHVFFVSDGTGITAETLGSTLLTQFEGQPFKKTTLPFITTPEKARMTVDYIDQLSDHDAERPVIFSTTVSKSARAVLRTAKALFIDIFDSHIHLLETEFGIRSTHAQGRAHSIAGNSRYQSRIEAMNFAMEHDDGQSMRDMSRAQLILVAPSRCGKTPTTLYLALQHGVFATNYPLLEEDLEKPTLPTPLRGFEDRIFGLTSDAERLSQVRTERRPGSRYASIAQCTFELRQAEMLYARSSIPFVNSANMSIEEIAATVMQEKALKIEA